MGEKIGRIGRQKKQTASFPLDVLLDLLALVSSQVVHDHDLARSGSPEGLLLVGRQT